MSENSQRFILRESFAGAWFIHDRSDDSTVCHIQKGRRKVEKTQAMAKVMLDALNSAVRREQKKGAEAPCDATSNGE